MKIHEHAVEERGETILSTRVPSDLSFKLPLVMRLLEALAGTRAASQSEREKLEVCFDEALQNAMVHGNGCDPTRQVSVRLFLEDDRWGLVVEDEGRGFGLEDVPDREDPAYPWKESGRGIALMEELSDSIEYFSRGRSLVLTFRRHERAAREGTEGKVLIAPRGPGSSSDGILDELTLAAVELRLLPPSRVVVDLSRVPYLTSSAIGQLVALKKTSLRFGHRLELVGVGPDLEEVFRSMRLDAVFSFRNERERSF